MNRNQKGFSSIEALLILVIVGIIGFAGWYVWQARSNTNKTLKDTTVGTVVKPQKESPTKELSVSDPTKDWVAYSNKTGKFSLKHPKTWIEASNQELCTPELLLVGGNKDSVGKCASEAFGQMWVYSETGDTTSNLALNSGYNLGYKNLVKTSITVDGVNGIKYDGVASGQDTNSVGDGPGGYEDGTRVVVYVFFTNNRTYSATYTQITPLPDVLNDFNLMVTKALKFSS